MIPNRRLLEREATKDMPRSTFHGLGRMAPSNGLQPDLKTFVINHEQRQALDIPIREKGQDDCITHDAPSLKARNAP